MTKENRELRCYHGAVYTQARSGVESGVTDSTQVTENPTLGERNRISPVKQNKR